MCLGIPGRIVEWADRDHAIAKAEVSGVRRSINVGLIDDVDVGDWVLIHVGFAMSRIEEDEAASTLEFLEQIGTAFEEEMAEIEASRIE